MIWLKCLIIAILFLQSLTSDVKIYWSKPHIYGQVYNVLYGSAVEFRCYNKTVDNLYEVSKEEYDRCEPMSNQRSLLNCTRLTQRGRDIYTTLIVKHDVPDPYFKDYELGQNYYFISTASNRGSDQERISNIAGGNCNYKDMKITLHVVNSLSKSTTDPSTGDSISDPDPGGQPADPGDAGNDTTHSPRNITNNDTEQSTPPVAAVEGLNSSERTANNSAHESSSISAILLLTLCYMLYS